MSELAAEWDQHYHWSKEERGNYSREGVQLSDTLVSGCQGGPLGGAQDWSGAQTCSSGETFRDTLLDVTLPSRRALM